MRSSDVRCEKSEVRNIWFLFSCFCFLAIWTQTSDSARIKDIARVNGVQEYQLVGYGLVVGLQRTGDSRSSLFTHQSVQNMLENLGLFTPDKWRAYPKNVAGVMVTANLPTFQKPGTRIDVRVSSMGDAKSLEGGILLLTPLQGVDGEIYATAQGELVVPKQDPTTGYILNGGIITSSIDIELKDEIYLNLISPDFTSSIRLQDAINKEFGSPIAIAMDGGSIKIAIPKEYKDKVMDLVARIEKLEVALDIEEKVVVDKNTGTVVSGVNVMIYPVRVNYKELKIEISEEMKVGEFIDMIYTLGVSSKEILDILRTLKSFGAIEAEVTAI